MAAYPLVPRDEVGFRMQVTSANTDEQIDHLCDVLGEVAERFKLRPAAAEKAGGHDARTRNGSAPPTAAHCGGCIWRRRDRLGLYVFVPPFQGSGPGDQRARPVRRGRHGRRHPPHRPEPGGVVLFVLGLSLFCLGDVYTYSYPKLTGADVPFPSPGDAMYLSVYPVLMVGLLLLVRRRNQRADGPGVVDSVIMTSGSAWSPSSSSSRRTSTTTR